MIQYIHGSVYWCALQVSLLSLAGVALSIMAARRRPATGCSIACVAVAVVAMLTLAAPLPTWRLAIVEAERMEVGRSPRTAPAPRGAARLASQPVEHRRAPGVRMLDLGQMLLTARSVLSKADLPSRDRGAALHVAIGCFAIAVAFGAIRLAVGIGFVLRTRRSSRPVADIRVSRLVAEVAERLGCRRVPEVREHGQLDSAAVAGWLRPVLIMPREWRSWSDDVLRAVIAHELAHIVRHDAFWRAAASSIAAMHGYNPLVHWLQRRVMLYQELAADQMAARVVGRRSYLCCLSQLAIQRDNRVRGKGRPDLLPVFSGHLIRRISMLHSKDGIEPASGSARRLLGTWVASSTLILLGVASFAARGLAQPPSSKVRENAKPAARVARADSTKGESDMPARRFGRPALDPTMIPENDTGMAVLRIGELLARPELQPYVPLLNQALAHWIHSEYLRDGEVPRIRLEQVEWVAGRAVVTVKKLENDPTGHHGSLMLAAEAIVIKLRQPFKLEDFVRRLSPSARHVVIEGQDVFELPPVPAIGPTPLWLSLRKDGILLANAKQIEVNGTTTLTDIFGTSMAGGSREESSWAASWKRIEGGLASVVFTDAKFDAVDAGDDDSEGIKKAAEKLFRELPSRCHQFAIGIDIAPGTSDMHLRFRLNHVSQASATETAERVRNLLNLARAETAKKIDNPGDDEDSLDGDTLKVLDTALRNADVSTELFGDGTADVVVESRMPFRQLVALYARAVTAKP